MKTLLRITILLIFYFLIYIVYKRFDSYIMLPITTLVLIAMFAYDFVKIRINLRKGKAIILGKDSSVKWSMIFGVVGGLIFIILGFRSNYNDFAHWGINSTSYLGLFFIALSLTNNENYSILLNDKYLIYKDFGINPVLRYRKIIKVHIHIGKMVIITKRDNIDYVILDNSQRIKLIDFLVPRLGDKLIINE